MTARMNPPLVIFRPPGRLRRTYGPVYPPKGDALGACASTPGVDYGPDGLVLVGVFRHPKGHNLAGGEPPVRVYKAPGHAYWGCGGSSHTATAYYLIQGHREEIATSEPAGRWRTALDTMRDWAVSQGYESSLFLYEQVSAAKAARKARLDRIYQTVCDVLAEQGRMIGDRPGRAAVDDWPETALFTIDTLAALREGGTP